MKTTECTDLPDISATFSNSYTAVKAAIEVMENALDKKSYYVKVGSKKYMEMRCNLPYAIHEMGIAGKQILVNRHYKPLGSNLPSYPDNIVYENQENLHTEIDKEKLKAMGRSYLSSDTAYLYGEADQPWFSKRSAKAYLENLRKLALILEASPSQLSAVKEGV